MEFLTNCVNRLSKELAAEQTTNQLLTSHVDDAFQRLRKGALRDSEDDTARHRIIDDAKLLHSHQWLEPQHPQVQHVRRLHTSIGILFFISSAGVARERETIPFIRRRTSIKSGITRSIREAGSQANSDIFISERVLQLNLLRNVAMKRKGEERRKVLQEFDFVIK